MSAGQTTPHYAVRIRGTAVLPFVLLDYTRYTATGQIVDMFRTESAARYAAQLLNRGVARVDSHAVVGCKVVVS